MSSSQISPVLVWFRRDLRLADNPALVAAVETGRPIIGVFIQDQSVASLGAAPKLRLGHALEVFARSWQAATGATLVLRSGAAQDVLTDIIRTTGASGVYWNQLYTPDEIERDTAIKSTLKEQGLVAESFAGQLLFEPHSVAAKTGTPFQVYTPFWRAVKDRDLRASYPAPSSIDGWRGDLATQELSEWRLGAAMQRGASIVAQRINAGEAAALAALDRFLEKIEYYTATRDIPSVAGTSGLSDYLAWGEISSFQIWNAVNAVCQPLSISSETFLKEIVWREFAYHLCFHGPHILSKNWKPKWDSFPWSMADDTAEVTAWKYGRTGIPFVDAAMREMYVTGKMHNRSRMIAGSYLTKHLMTHWSVGQKWFEECLIDWDPASNAMGWQWVAGSGPDASPFFRIFNPLTQADKFDPKGIYLHHWIAEKSSDPAQDALDFFTALPKALNFCANDAYPTPVVDHQQGRQRALEAYEQRSKD